METFTEQITLDMVICGECGIPFGLESSYHDRLRKDAGAFYCPNGHGRRYGKSEADKLRDKLKMQEENAEWWKNEAERTARSLSATRGQVTKLKKRVADGVCPCCQKSFKSLSKHMANMHPEFADSNAYLEEESGV